MKWFNRFFKRKTKSKIKEVLEEEDLEKLIDIEKDIELIFKKFSIIQFVLEENGNIHIQFNYNPTSVEEATNLAHFLYNLNKGKYQDNIAAILLEQSFKSPVEKQFVENVILAWNFLSNQNQNVNPVVSPIDFAGNDG
jgi:hypothetical protein